MSLSHLFSFEDPGLVRHDAGLVERGLPVQQHRVPVHKVAVHNLRVLRDPLPTKIYDP